MWKLKAGEPNIEVVDGPFAGKHFVAGAQYAEVPPEEEGRFEKVENVMDNQGDENTGGEIE